MSDRPKTPTLDRVKVPVVTFRVRVKRAAPDAMRDEISGEETTETIVMKKIDGEWRWNPPGWDGRPEDKGWVH